MLGSRVTPVQRPMQKPSRDSRTGGARPFFSREENIR